MIAGTRIQVGSLTEQPFRYFKQSLLLSVLLHGLIIAFLVSRENLANRVRVVPAQTVRSYLYHVNPTPVRSTSTVQQSSGAAASENVKSTMIASQKKSVKNSPKEKVINKSSDSPSGPSSLISRSSNQTVPRTTETSARDQFLSTLAGHCNPAEKQSEIRNCDNGSLRSSARRFERDLAVLFKPPPVNVKAKFKRDLAKVEQLSSELKHLDEMIDAAGVESEFLRQQQRRLTDEIHRIDSEYQEINLLDVLGSGIKTLKKGYETIRDKK